MVTAAVYKETTLFPTGDGMPANWILKQGLCVHTCSVTFLEHLHTPGGQAGWPP